LNEDDQRKRAIELYNNTETDRFNLLHAWEILRNKPKWLSQAEKATSTADQTTSSQSNQEVSINDDLDMHNRPPRRKASKVKGKTKAMSSESNETMSEAMERQIAVDKEKIDAMREYTAAIQRQSDVKQKRVKIKEQNMMMKFLRVDEASLSETQSKVYWKQMNKFLNE
jgi:No apical meristem-associated C-terminal domain